jgi:LuxR family maltose regulon positive regulatory protein
MLAESRRALEYLHPDNLPARTTAAWTLGYAYQLQGKRAAASQAYTEAIAISQATGNIMITLGATICLGQVLETENQLQQAAQRYGRVLELAGDPPLPGACEAYLGLARICYERNDLGAAEQHARQSLHLAQQLANIDTPAACQVFLARLKLAQGDAAGATAILAKADQFVQGHHFAQLMPAVAAAKVLALLRHGNLAAAAQLTQTHEIPVSRARVHLAQGDTSAALTVLESLRQQAEAKDHADERLKVMVLQAIALHAHGEKDKALQLLGDALALAEPGGFVRIFVDEGLPMAQLLSQAAARGIMADYAGKLLVAFEAEKQKNADKSPLPSAARAQPLIEPLSQRELEILQLIAQGLSNREIGERLFLALSTVKGHNLSIFGKLQVQSRTEAIARARELGLL